ncbi:zinc-binding dehydrogenase [Psychrobacillus sp. OK032]|uniref:zinc-binding dehydrogenase n=1 Tax=Psychrobacillus sp. OK032 TaxID=1884358 RepID=UPI0008C20ADD|nr:zinc-binding dehydrogenase [Psychrobacillus sp. OK032]SER82380.1 zinc-binding alcohol dehydrogenase/oxidoreductase [Psychrobacillus sp. OK032]
MKAFIHIGKPGLENTCYTDMVEGEPKKGEVKVRVKAAGLNHRDIWSLYRRGEEAGPVILGSDGAGVIHSVGEGVENVRLGDEIIINPSLGWLHKSDAQPNEFEVIGVPTNGTFAEYIIIPAENVEPKPKYLSWEEAGVIPVAALTAYRALFTRGKLQSNQTVLVPGIGSGVAIFVMLMAKAAGARVIVTSRSTKKCQQAIKLGADLAIDSESDWNEALDGEIIDLIIDSVGAATWDKALSVLKKGGSIVNFGATSGQKVEIDLRNLYFGQYNILGTTLGSHKEFREMIQFVEKHEIKPVIDKVYYHKDTIKAFERMNEGSQFGKICLIMD